MNNERAYTKRLVKGAIFLFLGLFLLLIIMLGIGWSVLRSDHPYVIEKLQERALEKHNAKLLLDNYELDFVEPFPLIQLQIKGLVYEAVDHSESKFIKVNQASSQFNPWNLITGDYNAHPFEFDSVWVHMVRDSLNNDNVSSNENEKHKEKRKGIDLEIDELPSFKFNYLDVNRQNNLRKAQLWVKMSHASITPERQNSGEWSANINGDSHFEQLLFKEKDGPYLNNKYGKLNLNIGLADGGKTILVDNSSLIVDEDEYLISGHFIYDDIDEIKLQIKNEGVLLSDALPLLSKTLNHTLKDIKVDQPIRANFTLTKAMKHGEVGAVRIDFATDDANIKYIETEMTNANLVGYFTNDRDNDGIGDPSTSAVVIDSLEGNLIEILPVRLKGEITQLKDNPQVSTQAMMDISMPQLNPLLSAGDKINFSDGNVLVNFNYEGDLQLVLTSPFVTQNISLSGDAVFTDVTLHTDSNIAPSPSLTGTLSFDESETRLSDLLLDWMGSKVNLKGKVSNLPEYLFYDHQALVADISLHFDQLDLDRFMDASKPKQIDEKGGPLNAAQVEKLAREWASNLNGEIDLEIDKLMYDTIFLTDVHTHLSLYTPRLSEYIDSSMINIQELTANFMGNSPMNVDLRIAHDSLTNILLGFNMPKAARTINLFLPDDTEIINGNLAVHIDAQASLSTLLSTKNLFKDVKLDGSLLFDELGLELPTVKLPVKKVSGELVFDKENLLMRAIGFRYQGSPFELDGTIENFTYLDLNTNQKAKLDLSLKGDFVNLRKKEAKSTDAKSTDPVASKSFNPAEMFAALDTVFQHTTGKVDLYLDSILTNKHIYQPFLLEAQLMCDSEKEDQHMVMVDSFYVGLGERNYLKGSMSITNPEQPYLDADLLARMKFKRVGDFLTSEYIEFKDGFFKLDVKYKTPLFDTLNAENYLLKAKVDGYAQIVDGKIFYNYRGFTFDEINGEFKFDQRALYIPNLDLNVNKNTIFAKGECTDFFPFFIQPDQKVAILLDLYSPHFDFGNFTVPESLTNDTIIANLDQGTMPEREVIETSTETLEQSKISQTAGFVDLLLSNGSLEMKTSVDKIIYSNFYAEAIKGNMYLKSDTVELRKMSMDVAEGKLVMDGSISETALHSPKMEIAVNLSGSNVSEIFRQFENFGQEKIGYKHIEGFTSVDLFFKAEADASYTIMRESLYGDMRFQLTGGQLENLPFFAGLKGFLYKKRRLDDVVIDTLDIYTSMRGSRMYLEKFNLHSTPFDFEVEGVYDISNQDSISLLLSVPLGNLGKRYVKPKNLKSKTSLRKGPHIYIESRYKDDKLKFAWKPFIFLRKTRYAKPEEPSKENIDQKKSDIEERDPATIELQGDDVGLNPEKVDPELEND